MKRITALILIWLYFVTSTGATIHYHYCMGEMANSSLWENKEKKCGKCGMDERDNVKSGCCKDEQQWLKIDTDQKANVVQFDMPKLQPAIMSIFIFDRNTFAARESLLTPESKALLRSSEVPTYLFNRVFRI